MGPFIIGDQHTQWLLVRDRGSLNHLFTDGERRGSEERGVESLFNTNRFAPVLFDAARTDGRRGKRWFLFTNQRPRGEREVG